MLRIPAHVEQTASQLSWRKAGEWSGKIDQREPVGLIFQPQWFMVVLRFSSCPRKKWAKCEGKAI
jgi:hypothetical protein